MSKIKMMFRGEEIDFLDMIDAGKSQSFINTMTSQETFDFAKAIARTVNSTIATQVPSRDTIREALARLDVMTAIVGMLMRCEMLIDSASSYEQLLPKMQAELDVFLSMDAKNKLRRFGKLEPSMTFWGTVDVRKMFVYFAVLQVSFMKVNEGTFSFASAMKSVKSEMLAGDFTPYISDLITSLVDAWSGSGLMTLAQYPDLCEIVTQHLDAATEIEPNGAVEIDADILVVGRDGVMPDDEVLVKLCKMILASSMGKYPWMFVEMALDAVDSELILL